MPRIADSSAIPSAGWAVLHLVFAIAGDRTDELDLTEAQALVDEKDAQAAALGYVADTKRADAKKYPKHAATQNCTNCTLYQGKPTDKAGGCALFGGKQVAGPGWCSAWAKKA